MTTAIDVADFQAIRFAGCDIQIDAFAAKFQIDVLSVKRIDLEGRIEIAIGFECKFNLSGFASCELECISLIGLADCSADQFSAADRSDSSHASVCVHVFSDRCDGRIKIELLIGSVGDRIIDLIRSLNECLIQNVLIDFAVSHCRVSLT